MGGDFSYDDANNDFVWNASNSLVVFGSAFVTTDNFTNYGNISADTLTLSVAGDFDYGSEFLGNGNIDATTLNLQVGGDFSYDDASNDFVWNASDSLVVLGSAFITADDFSNYGAINVVNDFNVTAADYFSNQDNATINANSFNVTAGGGFVNYYATISADNFNVTAGKDFYNTNSATIDANNFNVTAGGNFYNQYYALIVEYAY